MNAPGDFHADLSGLAAGITYYYRARADGGAHGTSYGAENSFTTATLPPSVTTNAVSHKTTDSAALNGTLDALGTASSVNASFIYGTNPGGPYTNSTPPQSMAGAADFQASVAGLTPFTTYYYRARADGGIYGIAYGSEVSFTTNHLPPVVSTEGASDVMTNAAILNGDLYLKGTADTVNASFEWGTTHGGPYPNSTSTQAMTEPDIFHTHINGLSAHTTYYFRAKGDGGAQGIGYGEENAFTTGTIPPSVTTGEATDITSASAVLHGNLDLPGSAAAVNVFFQYGNMPGGPYPNSTPAQAMTSPGAFQAALSGLFDNSPYYFRAVAIGDNTVYGAEHSFITWRDPSVPQHPRSSSSAPKPIPPAMSIQYLNVNPEQASIGQTVTITANVVNAGDIADGYAAILKINGKVEQTRSVSVGPRATQPVKFTVRIEQPGTYTVNIGNQKSNLTVTDVGHTERQTGQTILLIAAMAIIGLLAVLLLIVARRRFQNY
jgi:hypothetical protein